MFIFIVTLQEILSLNYTCSSKLRQVDWYIAQLKIAVVGTLSMYIVFTFL